MSSIYIKAASFLHGSYYDRNMLHELFKTIPFLVFHRGLLDCLAPRIEQIIQHQRQNTSHRAACQMISIALNASCTYHLTREAIFDVCCEQDFRTVEAAMRKLTQVASLTIVYDDRGTRHIHVVYSELSRRFALTLTKLDVCYVGVTVPAARCMPQLALAITDLRNLKELELPSLTAALCNAIAAGPGPRLRELLVERFNCQPTDLDALVAGCPNILALSMPDYGPFDFVVSASKLPYLQAFKACVNNLPLETDDTDLRIAFSDMAHLTKLNIQFTSLGVSSSMAAILATTVGPQLLELTLRSLRYASDAFATLCCASSFPQLRFLSLRSGSGISRIEHVATVSLSPWLSHLTLSCFELVPRTLAQLLNNKPSLTEIDFDSVNIERFDPTTSATNAEHDWFGQLVKSPLQKVRIAGTNLTTWMDTRVALLAGTLVGVTVHVDENWLLPLRDAFVGVLCRKCVLLEQIFVGVCTRNDSSTLIDAGVAFAGLRNNERLRGLSIVNCRISNLAVLVDELLAMRSPDLQRLSLPQTELSLEQCIAVAERFAHLESVAANLLEGDARQLLRQRFPRVIWPHFR